VLHAPHAGDTPEAMTPRATIERAHALLDEAALARERRSHDRCLRLLTEAQELLRDTDDRALLGKVSWRLAKAAYDFGTPEQMLDAVTPLLEVGEAFAHHKPGRRAMAPISRRWWDTRGYADARVPRLWEACAASYRAEGDPWLEAMAHSQRAWHLACAGEHGALDQLIERYLATDPRHFGTGPHRHPDAPDTRASVWWAQLELVRTGLWAAAWSGRRDRARDLADAFQDAAEGAELDPASDPWFLDPLLRVALAFELDELLAATLDPWRHALAASDSDRAPFHLALGEGLVALRDGDAERALPSLQRAVALTEQRPHGAEWSVDALRHRARAEAAAGRGDPDTTVALAQRLSTRFGLGVFLG
jgi:hypothetical protein